MMRLTPSKIRGFKLPDKSLRLTKRGNTSLIYRTDDPNLLEVYTIEPIKFDWWDRGLGIIDSYTDVGWAHYQGYDYFGRRWSDAQWRDLDMTVWKAYATRLQMPDAAQLRQIRRIRRKIENVCLEAWRTHPFQGYDRINVARWDMLTENADLFPEIAPALDFVQDYNNGDVAPDFGLDDFAIQNGRIVVLDPFHHADVHKALRLTRRRG